MSDHEQAKFAVHPVSGALGAEIHGISLARLTDEEFEQVHEQLLKHLVLFFPDQSDLTPQAHVAFGRRFGEPEIHPFLPSLEGHPEVVIIDSTKGGKADVWHTDVTFTPNPPIASVLQLLESPDVGGDTMWSNQYLAYERLSEPMRDLLDGLTAVHYIEGLKQGYESRTEHPVVRVHPETGRRSLFVNRLFTSHIPQLTRHESDALLAYLFDFSELPQYTCRYRWSTGTVAMWDNRCTQHHAVNDYTEPRIGQRVTILGDKPTGGEPRWGYYKPVSDERYWPRIVGAKLGYEEAQ